MSTEVLCTYNTRYIQRYIFAPGSDEVQIGAGILVARILPEALKAALQASGLSENEYRIDYAGDPEYVPFFDNGNMMAELVALGGGNAIMLYKSLELCRKVNRLFSRYILEHTHSLQIDMGIISKTDSFSFDISRIHRQADHAKNMAITSRPMGGLPIVQVQRETGYPLSAKNPDTKEKITMDNFCKLAYYPAEYADLNAEDGVAYIHIDGNEVSFNVNNALKGASSYKDGIIRRRRVSAHITSTYQASLDSIKERFTLRYGDAVNRYFQVLNFGGDDINLRCSKPLAMEVATCFTDCLQGKYYERGPEGRAVPFTVSIGIAYVSGDVNFFQGQRMSAKCCNLAKIEAKKPANRINGIAGNWMDYCVYETQAPANLPVHPCPVS